MTWSHILNPVFPTSEQAVLAPNRAEEYEGGGNNGKAEDEPASRSEAESQFQRAEDEEESGGEEESEDASEGQPDRVEYR